MAESEHRSVAPVVGPDDPRRFTDSGIELSPVYGPADLPADLDRRLGGPGEYPFTRGVHPEMYRRQLWTIRQYAGYASAKESNQRYRYLLEQGSTGLSMAFDLPTQLGLDSDDPRCLGEVGRTGVAIDTIDDMRTAFEGIPLGRVSTSMTINAPASVLLLLYELVGEEQGVPANELRGTVQNDILKEYIARGNFIYPPAGAVRLTTDLFSYCREKIPKWNTISISGYHFREKGASAVQEVAFTLSNGIAYVQAAIDAGLEVDEFAPRLAFFFNAHNNVFQEVAKFRAARRMWAKIMRERFGARDERSMRLRFHTQTGGVTLTAQQPENNIVRVALQAFAAVCGGTQSLHSNGFDEALALPTERAAKIAVRTQQILAYESGAADTVDPFAGSYFIEALTDEVEQRASELIGRVDELGGAVAADRLHQGRDRGVGVRLPRALSHRAGHRRRSESLRRGGGRGARHHARRSGDRASAGGPPRRLPGEPRCGRCRGGARAGSRHCAGNREHAPAAAPGAQGSLHARRGLRRDARCLRPLPTDQLKGSSLLLTAVFFWQIALAVHIIFVVAAFGLLLAYPFIMVAMERFDRQSVPVLLRVRQLLGRSLVNPGLLIVVIAGVYLAHQSPPVARVLRAVGYRGGARHRRARGCRIVVRQIGRLAELAERDISVSLSPARIPFSASDGRPRGAEDQSDSAEIVWSSEFLAARTRHDQVNVLLAMLVVVTIFLMVVQ